MLSVGARGTSSREAFTTNTVAGDGTFKFMDTNAPNLKARYYRAVLVP